MAEKEPTQRSQPKKGEPIEIPVPKRDEVLGVFDRAAQPLPKSRRRKGRWGK
jgi:hypothetical protein